MKRRIFSITLLFALLMTAACGGPAEPPAKSQPGDGSRPADISSEAGKITFTDALGQDFSIDPPERAVVMIGSFANVWALAGGEDTLAATANDAWESYGLELEEGEVLVTLRDRAQRTIGQGRVTRQEGERQFLTFDGVAEGSLSVEEWPHG